jgi:hypothetical protein
MHRRKFIGAVAAVTATTFSSQAFGALGGLGKIADGSDKSSGGASWKDLAKSFGEAKAAFADTAQKQALIAADMAEALDLRSEAEVLRGEANNLSEKGDAMGSGDLSAVSENSASTQALIEAKLKEAESLSDDQKAALSKAAVEYVPTLIAGISVAKSVKDAVQTASGLGTPGFRDGRAAISAAKDIPVLGPKMIKFLIDSVKGGKSMMSLMKTKGVAIPDNSEMDSQLSDFA